MPIPGDVRVNNQAENPIKHKVFISTRLPNLSRLLFKKTNTFKKDILLRFLILPRKK